MNKITQIRSAYREIRAEEAKTALMGAFAPFGSLSPAPLASAVADAMIEVADGNLAGLTNLGEALAMSSSDQICTMEFRWYEVTIVTPTSGTKISLLRGTAPGWYGLRVDFPGGSSYRAQEITAAFKAAGVDCKAA